MYSKQQAKTNANAKINNLNERTMTDVAGLYGSFIEFDEMYNKDSLSFNVKYYMGINGRQYNISSKRFKGGVILNGRKITGDIRFKGVNDIFKEPNGGWNLRSFINAITIYQKKWRKKEENYFLGGYDYQHVQFFSMKKVDGVYEIAWD